MHGNSEKTRPSELDVGQRVSATREQQQSQIVWACDQTDQEWQDALLDASWSAHRAIYTGSFRQMMRSRYMTVGNGMADPARDLLSANVEPDVDAHIPAYGVVGCDHQSVWTPGRPYLMWQHALDPDTGECHIAPEIGSARGVKPGDPNSEWRFCGRAADRMPLLPGLAQEPPDYGWLLRQHPLASGQPFQWWDLGLVPLESFPAEHLEAALAWLTRPETLQKLVELEERRLETVAPCPIEAYSRPVDWLNDLPLFQAMCRQASP